MGAVRTLRLVKPAPPPERPAPPPLQRGTCPVCQREATDWDWWKCDVCGVGMHPECWWGRVATLEEWQRWLDEWIAPETTSDDAVACVCPTCRAEKRS